MFLYDMSHLSTNKTYNLLDFGKELKQFFKHNFSGNVKIAFNDQLYLMTNSAFIIKEN